MSAVDQQYQKRSRNCWLNAPVCGSLSLLKAAITMLYLGTPQWQNPNWLGHVFGQDTARAEMLANYGQLFNSVEGNTTFYASPSPATLANWLAAVPDDFRFTFKLPKRLSHELQLQHGADELAQWLQLFTPALSKIGSVLLQLPATFGPEQLPLLADFLRQWPTSWPLAVEVRHLAFFDKAEQEVALNRLLRQYQVERVIMDTRALFSTLPASDAERDAHRKKPRLPVHAQAQTERPIVRFVGASLLANNQCFLAPWVSKVQQWLAEGKSPMLFFHTADNRDSAHLARLFCQQLSHPAAQQHAVLSPFPAELTMQQPSLF